MSSQAIDMKGLETTASLQTSQQEMNEGTANINLDLFDAAERTANINIDLLEATLFAMKRARLVQISNFNSS